MTRDALLALIREAALAPSVHNVQPARWRLADDGLILFEDLEARLSVGDPDGNDAAISLGAAVEGLSLAASQSGLTVELDEGPLPEATATLRPITRVRFENGAPADPLADVVSKRQSWRGMFAPANSADRETLHSLQSEDCEVFAGDDQLDALAKLVDDASFGFMRDAAFRRELVSWMRLSRRHERWAFDGLNAQAMNLGAVEAAAAGLVLGPVFSLLDGLSLAGKALAETAKTTSAAGILLFHRPGDEPPFDSGRAFYRLWLRIEAAGMGAAVLAALADSPEAASELARQAGLPADRRVVSAFRVGRRPDGATYPRARRPIEELLV